MKFITEIDLRDLYRKEPFTDYKIEPGTRLTPGARQFLADRGINKFDNGSYAKKNDVNKRHLSELPKKQDDWKKKKLRSRMKSVEALFFVTEEEFLSRDVFLAQSIIDLGKQFTKIKNALDSKSPIEDLCLKECTGINADNFSNDLDDCFEITDFHVQLKNGRDIIILHRLRCALREIEPVVLEAYEDSDDGNELLYKDIIGKVNQIINALSQRICSIFGGKKCQRKN
ncbi:ethanolamine utilization protein [Clostridium sp. MT-14]|jgi:ethanolamine utilization cobalamin adenosyltransferase|uniref:ethanolamine utilization protein n=1 Tax=unclassified Clostridium TaxID=2614128 RepID=UPI001239A391|nr:ethanolamine utilization protein [Clostridium sp. HV4-5-A1G]KAA8674401.1 ethanolamine utilization protein [Clostridium sp. HV4-5-A1G]CAB1252680.1 conserved hypothetical protein [Clostridiaceae bacterium BL-3]